jgi:8-oxo-dGTP diphosphatase
VSRPQGLPGLLSVYARTAWWGLVSPRTSEIEPLLVHQAVVLRDGEVLLAVRSDIRGWELPGGNPDPGETGEQTLAREVREETGIEVEVERRVGDYVRTGFRPHTARVWQCRALGGELRPSVETPVVEWFATGAVPTTLLPWYREPLADALAEHAEPVVRRERWGASEIVQAIAIDLRMRATGLRAGRRGAR